MKPRYEEGVSQLSQCEVRGAKYFILRLSSWQQLCKNGMHEREPISILELRDNILSVEA